MSENTNNTSKSIPPCVDPFKGIKMNEYGTPEVAGLYYISRILKKIHEQLKNKKSIYANYIYRGVSKLYTPKNCIRSGAAVRLSYTNPEFTYSNYISYIQNLVAEAKHNFPSKYGDYSDLEILADLQHNGAATCLVDFSKNILISLWFACGENQKNDGNKAEIKTREETTEGLQEKDGVLYCYNYVSDAVVNQQLNILKPSEVKDSIQKLLRDTQPLAKYAEMLDYSFSLWNPSVVNNRIARQDSVFVFGLPQFKVAEHDIICIQIRNEFKASIRKALTSYFNISNITIFNDSHGYASVNDKLASMDMLEDEYQLGLNEMLAGNYDLALEHFLRQTGNTSNKRSAKDHVDIAELHLSIAICYTNLLHDFNIVEDNVRISNYVANAKNDYEKAIENYETAIPIYAKKAINAINLKKVGYNAILFYNYAKKLMRTYSRLIELLLENELYNECLEYAKKQLKITEKLIVNITAINEILNELKIQESPIGQGLSEDLLLKDFNVSNIEITIQELRLLLLLSDNAVKYNLQDKKTDEEKILQEFNNKGSKRCNSYEILLKIIFVELYYSYLEATIEESEIKKNLYEILTNNIKKLLNIDQQNDRIFDLLIDYLSPTKKCDVAFIWDLVDLTKAVRNNDKLEEKDKEKIILLFSDMSKLTEIIQAQQLNRS